MSAKPASGADPASRLVERLRALRETMAKEPGDRRRGELARELKAQLDALAPAERAALVERALATIRPAAGAGGGEGATGSALAEARAGQTALQAERDKVSGEAEKLLREGAKLRAERDALKAELAELRKQGGVAKAAPPPKGAPGAGGSLEGIREGLRMTLDGKKVDVNALGLQAGEIRLFRLAQELVNFVHMLEIGRVTYLNQLEAGGSALDTRGMTGLKEQVRKTIRATLNDEEGSIQKLKATLMNQNKFVTGLTDAFQVAFTAGSKAFLDELDPEAILEKAKGRFVGTDWEKAFNEFARRRSDLTNQTATDLFQLYFRDPFKAKLGEWVKD